MKEAKDDRFCRLAEARVNKIIKMVRLLGNCSNEAIYTHTPEQVDQIFTALRAELDAAQARFRNLDKSSRKRFTLSETERDKDVEYNLLLHPGVSLALPDGTILRAAAFPDKSYPAINIYTMSSDGTTYEQICFVEFNPERAPGHRICAGVYQSEEEETTYYEPYVAERKSNE
ncbi:MAG: hypothetical protein IJO56_10230 [Oscillospiraceae bacterium]|nr:hypothetical protein [Oscillospiraceae bacterium]